MDRILAIIALVLLGGAATAQEQHRFRRDAGAPQEALAEAWALFHREGLSPEEGDHLLAALRRALDTGADFLSPPLGEGGAPFAPKEAREVRFAARRVATRLVAALPEPLWRRWRDLHGPAAAASQVGRLTLHPGTEAQGRALVAAATEALEAGFFGTAARHLLSYEEVFARHPTDAPLPWPRVGLLMCLAGAQGRDPDLVARGRSILEREKGPVVIAGRRVEADRAVADILAAPSPAPWRYACGGGGPSRCAVAPALAFPLEAAWHRALGDREPGTPPIEVLADERRAFVASSTHISALDLETGRELWSRKLPQDFERGAPPDGSAHHTSGALGAGAWILVIPGRAAQDGGALIAALERTDGTERWRRCGSDDPDLGLRTFTCAPGPVIADGTLVVAGLGAAPEAGTWVLGFDAATGRLRWRTLVAAADAKDLPLRSVRTLAISAHRGIVYLNAPHLGRVAALDLESGAPRWIAEERGPDPELARIRPARLTPRLQGDRLILSPGPRGGVAELAGDATPAIATDADPRPLLPWRLLRPDAPEILAATPERLLLAATDPTGRYPLILGLDRRGAAPAVPPLPLDSPVAGHAAATKCGVLVASGKYVFLVDPRTGIPGAPVIGAESAGTAVLGNLVPVSGGLISVTANRISAWRSAP